MSRNDHAGIAQDLSTASAVPNGGSEEAFDRVTRLAVRLVDAPAIPAGRARRPLPRCERFSYQSTAAVLPRPGNLRAVWDQASDPSF